ncbi:hypothetical protein IV203_028747 [Nitzschia inconspicua]|uniref:Uncharacterized protein n=1 Tax=Nitzschia inconspicua TaxID=303405 RepID=A0A9K3LQ56_9STRA|nr:hypothetical protein IV203_028747 [Nitzschia inconspicua]
MVLPVRALTGSIESLKGCVYDIGGNGENTDNFGRITMKIAIYIAANIKGGGEFRHAMKPDVLKFEELTVPGISDEQKRDTAQLVSFLEKVSLCSTFLSITNYIGVRSALRHHHLL